MPGARWRDSRWDFAFTTVASDATVHTVRFQSEERVTR